MGAVVYCPKDLHDGRRPRAKVTALTPVNWISWPLAAAAAKRFHLKLVHMTPEEASADKATMAPQGKAAIKESQRKKLPKGRRERVQGPRVSTTDPDARVMRMGDGGFRPAFTVQLATTGEGRASVGVKVSQQGTMVGWPRRWRPGG